MNAAPTAAVVIPTYGRPRGLRNCLRSVLLGDRKPDEVWVCDQTRDEDVRREIADMCHEMGVAYLHLDTPNASRARNAGAEAASADLVAFTDDDCLAARGWLSALVREYVSVTEQQRAGEITAVTGRVLPMLRGRRIVPVSTRESTEPRLFPHGASAMARGEWTPWETGNGPNILVPRDVFLAAGGFDATLGPGTAANAAEDIDLLYRLLLRGTVSYQPTAVVYHLGKTRKGRLLSRFNYGLGMGTMLARHINRGDLTARRLLWVYVRHQLGNVYRRGVWGPPETALVLAGIVKALTTTLSRSMYGGQSDRAARGAAGASQATGSSEFDTL